MAMSSNIIRQCGALAIDAVTFGLMRKAADRERMELSLSLQFPDNWRELIDTMDRFDRASTGRPTPLIRQMWAHGICHIEETIALLQACPAAFRGTTVAEVVGAKASEALPRLAANLP